MKKVIKSDIYFQIIKNDTIKFNEFNKKLNNKESENVQIHSQAIYISRLIRSGNF